MTATAGRGDSAAGPGLYGPWTGRRPFGIVQTTGALVWLGFILFPVVNAVTARGTALRHWLEIAGAVVFAAGYVALILAWRRSYADRVVPALFLLLLAIASALTLADGGGWGFLFIYCAACAALLSPRYGFAGVMACTVLVGVTSALGGASGGTTIGWVAASAGIGMLMLVQRDLRIRNGELRAARAELARMAVAEERERFARDLHDLLGHSLSLIALKSELVGRLLPERPHDAAREVADVEMVARQALSEVREAVSGYRRPTLEGELEGAQMALAAAGIRLSTERPELTLDPEAEAVLAWAVREGVTNVIRHSQARNVSVRVTAGLEGSRVEVTNDGVRPGVVAGADKGSGLAGLEQRAAVAGGTFEAGPLPGGGFRLVVGVPPTPHAQPPSRGGDAGSAPEPSASVVVPGAPSTPGAGSLPVQPQ